MDGDIPPSYLRLHGAHKDNFNLYTFSQSSRQQHHCVSAHRTLTVSAVTDLHHPSESVLVLSTFWIRGNIFTFPLACFGKFLSIFYTLFLFHSSWSILL